MRRRSVHAVSIDPEGDADGSQSLDPKSDEFAYTVAAYAWRDGLTANSIARELGYRSTPRNLMRIKRALRRAHGRFLTLKPMPHDQLRDDLCEKFNQDEKVRDIRFYVVNDFSEPASAAVFARAAELAMQFITQAALGKSPDGFARTQIPTEGSQQETDVIICNAGGQTVSETVKALVRSAPLLDASDKEADRLRQRLRFVAGNAAFTSESFHQSASFLSVTMAEVFGARHTAMPVEDEAALQRHGQLVETAALFICGAGTRESGLMADKFEKKGFQIPDAAVGDIAFNMVNKDGADVRLSSQEAMDYLRHMNPSLDLSRLLHIASQGRVLLILHSEPPELKTAISLAALKRRYATDVVLGARLARELIKEIDRS